MGSGNEDQDTVVVLKRKTFEMSLYRLSHIDYDHTLGSQTGQPSQVQDLSGETSR